MDVAEPQTSVRWFSLCLALLAGLFGIGCSTFQGTTAKSFLRKVQESRDPNERYVAYEKLGNPSAYDDEADKVRVIRVLCSKLARKDAVREEYYEPAASRAMICRTLGRLGHPSARETILATVNDVDPLIRSEACLALGRVGKAEDATVLARVMTADTSPDCRIAAIDALGQLKSSDPRINSFLANAMEADDDPAIRLAALNALKKTTGQDLGIEAKNWHEYLARMNPESGKPTTSIVNAPQKPASSPAVTTDKTVTPAAGPGPGVPPLPPRP
jgi:hypothetical protein